ncbi:MAG: hypothetical protein ACPGUD_12495, partial [Parashewanella sp.]
YSNELPTKLSTETRQTGTQKTYAVSSLSRSSACEQVTRFFLMMETTPSLSRSGYCCEFITHNSLTNRNEKNIEIKAVSEGKTVYQVQLKVTPEECADIAMMHFIHMLSSSYKQAYSQTLKDLERVILSDIAKLSNIPLIELLSLSKEDCSSDCLIQAFFVNYPLELIFSNPRAANIEKKESNQADFTFDLALLDERAQQSSCILSFGGKKIVVLSPTFLVDAGGKIPQEIGLYQHQLYEQPFEGVQIVQVGELSECSACVPASSLRQYVHQYVERTLTLSKFVPFYVRHLYSSASKNFTEEEYERYRRVLSSLRLGQSRLAFEYTTGEDVFADEPWLSEYFNPYINGLERLAIDAKACLKFYQQSLVKSSEKLEQKRLVVTSSTTSGVQEDDYVLSETDPFPEWVLPPNDNIKLAWEFSGEEQQRLTIMQQLDLFCCKYESASVEERKTVRLTLIEMKQQWRFNIAYNCRGCWQHSDSIPLREGVEHVFAARLLVMRLKCCLDTQQTESITERVIALGTLSNVSSIKLKNQLDTTTYSSDTLTDFFAITLVNPDEVVQGLDCYSDPQTKSEQKFSSWFDRRSPQIRSQLSQPGLKLHVAVFNGCDFLILPKSSVIVETSIALFCEADEHWQQVNLSKHSKHIQVEKLSQEALSTGAINTKSLREYLTRDNDVASDFDSGIESQIHAQTEQAQLCVEVFYDYRQQGLELNLNNKHVVQVLSSMKIGNKSLFAICKELQAAENEVNLDFSQSASVALGQSVNNKVKLESTLELTSGSVTETQSQPNPESETKI